jgi:5-methylcytosine-specific restriction protein A
MREVAEWLGQTDNAQIPNRVKLRIWMRAGGCCQGCGRRIRPGERWDIDHTVALCNGGEHREGNFQVMAIDICGCHKRKTAADVAEKRRIDRNRKRHAGIKKPRTITTWRRFDGTPVYAGRER